MSTCLDNLHEKYLESLSGPEQLEYLLSCQDYLREDDVSGWKKRFRPELLQETTSQEKTTTKRKKRRMSPDAVIWQPHPNCVSCGSKEVIEDMTEGSVVCLACGLIQNTMLIGMGAAHLSYGQLRDGNRKIVHHYSRVTYFRSFVTALQGKTEPIISQEGLADLRRSIGGDDSSVINEETVVLALKRMKLSTKLRRHKYTLAGMLNPDFKQIRIPYIDFFELLRLFRKVEYYYNWFTKKKLGGRKVFYSYPYVFYQLCYSMDKMEYTGTHHLLRDRGLLKKLHDAYAFTAFRASLKCDLTIYRD